MVTITDVSPVKTTNPANAGRSVTGRMLSIACQPDGQALYAGSYSNLWASDDGGQNWGQLVWPQPPAGVFDSPGALGGWCVVDVAVGPGWRVDRHPRFLTRFAPRGHVGIIGFGECGVWTALGNGDGTFQDPKVVLADFGYEAGGWRVDRHPRFVVDLTGDGRVDIVGFGGAGVWTALGNGDGTFQPTQFGIANFGYDQHWRVDRHPRFLALLTDSGFADIVGFGTDGVWTALGNGDGTFSEPNANPVLANFGHHQHWRVDRHPRFVLDLTGDGHADIVGFGTDGVFTALGDGDGTFSEPHANPVLHQFGYHQGWRVDRHPRLLARLTTTGFADIVGFGEAGAWVALGNGDGTFNEPFPNPVLDNFGEQQGWRVDEHPRFLADLTGSGERDIVGFGDAGVWTALGEGQGRFADAAYVVDNFDVDQGWRVDEHPRFVVDVTGDGHADIVGFGDAGIWTALGDGHGGFSAPQFVLPAFGSGATVLAITQQDRARGSHGIWRSPDGGASWTKVHTSPPAGEALGQLEWALGSDHLVYAAGGSSLAVSKNGGISFKDVLPWGRRGAGSVNHVAVWQNSPADPAPAVIYALGDSTMFLSFDGGTTWMRDRLTTPDFPASVGAAASTTGNGNSPRVMAISPRFPLEVFVAGDGSSNATPAVIHRGDYTEFPFGTKTSSWDTLPLPDALSTNQDSGNVFLIATQRGRGNLLFYGAQRTPVYVGPLDPGDASDWHPLDPTVHADLHGILLSPDFAAELRDGRYTLEQGTVWLLGDGGLYRSTDGGTTFQHGFGATTLASVNVAGVSAPGQGPALSLGTGDNDGFSSGDGGANWSYQEYGGGDDDCSFADPLRPSTILVFTPRWDTEKELPPQNSADDPDWDGNTVTVYEAPAGSLPSTAPAPGNGHVVPGPAPLVPKRDRWNASSSYGSRGSRPIVRRLSGEDAPGQGDYVFVLDPTANPVLVRTQNILDIQSRDEWNTSATGPGQGANVFLQGPPLPTGDLGVVQASGGHWKTVFYVGGTSMTLWKWTAGMPAWRQLVPGQGADLCVRFFVDPYRPQTLYLLDSDHVKRSDDGGNTWQNDQALETQLTWNGQLAFSTDDISSGLQDFFDLLLTDMQFDPVNPSIRFAVGQGGAFGTNDGANWLQLLHSGALPCRPANCYYDWITDEFDPALTIALAGRSILKLTDLFPPVIV